MDSFEDIKKNIEDYSEQAREGIADAKYKLEQARDTICGAYHDCEKGINDTYEYLAGPGHTYFVAGLGFSTIAMMALNIILVYFLLCNKKKESTSTIDTIADEIRTSLKDFGEQALSGLKEPRLACDCDCNKEFTIEKIAEEAKESFKEFGEEAQDAGSMVIDEAEKIVEDAKQSLENFGEKVQDTSSMVIEEAEKIATDAKKSFEDFGEEENHIGEVIIVVIVALIVALGVYICVSTDLI